MKETIQRRISAECRSGQSGRGPDVTPPFPCNRQAVDPSWSIPAPVGEISLLKHFVLSLSFSLSLCFVKWLVERDYLSVRVVFEYR